MNGGNGGSVNNSGQHGGGGGGSTGIALFKNQPQSNYSVVAIEGTAGNDCSSCTIPTAAVGGSCGSCVQQGWSTTGGIVLPVTVVSFKGEELGEVARLEWEVMNESSIRNYIIEKSSDGKNFNVLTEQPAQNHSELHTYYASDENPSPGDNYYRLRVVHDDDSRSTEGAIMLNFSGADPVFKLFPNPAGESVTITSLPGAVISVVDSKGAVVINEMLDSGSVKLDISGLSPGIYRAVSFHAQQTTSSLLVKF